MANEIYIYASPKAKAMTLMLDSAVKLTGVPVVVHDRDDGFCFQLPDDTPVLPPGTPWIGAQLDAIPEDPAFAPFQGRGIVFPNHEGEAHWMFDDIRFQKLGSGSGSMPPPLPGGTRPGTVQVSGKTFRDDAGGFFPLGDTLFWIPGGIQREGPDRARQNLRYVKQHRSDFVRMLGSVGWAGEAIDPRSPGYALAQAIDIAYEEGLRTEVTIIGGGLPDPRDLARLIYPIIEARRQKVILVEAVNEGNASHDDAVEIAKMFKPLGLPTATGVGDAGLDIISETTVEAGVNVACLHTERQPPDERQARQCWDLKDIAGRAVNDGEPPGPKSSVAEQTNPVVLASFRAGAIICGSGMYVRHSGHGVFGRTYAYGGATRYANLYDVPNMDTMLDAQANASAHLPEGIEHWTKFNSGQPVDVPAGNVNKLYGATDGGRFAEIAIGVTGGGATFRVNRACHLQVIDSTRGVIVIERQCAAGEQVNVGGLWAPVLVGTYV